jgi:hypothetical protein
MEKVLLLKWGAEFPTTTRGDSRGDHSSGQRTTIPRLQDSGAGRRKDASCDPRYCYENQTVWLSGVIIFHGRAHP